MNQPEAPAATAEEAPAPAISHVPSRPNRDRACLGLGETKAALSGSAPSIIRRRHRGRPGSRQGCPWNSWSLKNEASPHAPSWRAQHTPAQHVWPFRSHAERTWNAAPFSSFLGVRALVARSCSAAGADMPRCSWCGAWLAFLPGSLAAIFRPEPSRDAAGETLLKAADVGDLGVS